MLKTSIIVTYRKNKLRFLPWCLSHLKKQTVQPFEVIIIEDCLTNKEKGDVNLIQQTIIDLEIEFTTKVFQFSEMVGKSVQINKGISLAEGEYIGICSADDYYEKNFIEENLKALENGDVSWSNYDIVNEKGGLLQHQTTEEMNYKQFIDKTIEWAKTHGMFCCMATWFARKKVFENCKFDENLLLTEDLEWLLKATLIRKYKFVFINKPLANYRVNSSQAGNTLHLKTLQDNNEYSRQKVNKALGRKIF